MSGTAADGGLFLPTPHGRTFCVRTGAGSTCVVLVPPFAEEMNRARRMYTLLSAALAARGYSVLLPDLHGTGESDGDFADARWSLWLDDLEAARRFARDSGARRVAWVGLRLGALLALEAAARETLPPTAAVVLWQPVASGELYVNQFLRLRLAAGLRRPAAERETAVGLRERVRAEGTLEVAGYALASELVAQIDAKRLEVLGAAVAAPLHWFELSMAERPAATPAGLRVAEALSAGHAPVRIDAVRGEAFWSTAEVTVVPELVDATVRRLEAA